MKGLLRFSPVEKGFYLARCAPDGFILPALGEHFLRRFGEVPWAIIDEKRNLMLIRRPGEAPRLEAAGSGTFAPGPGGPWEDLWRLYHRSVTIENRKKPALQRQCMPARYWKYLPEMSPENQE
jgi:probable DNA metabolism protein